jgi:hypothetical protein
LRLRARGSSLLVAIAVIGAASSSIAQAETSSFDGPSFRKGLWRFARTLEYQDHVQQRNVTRCVDPTNAMRGTFASPDIGNCRSARAERVANRYTFANRCDYMGPVQTQITVHSDEAYTELNIPKAVYQPIDKVVARRIGDCEAVAE